MNNRQQGVTLVELMVVVAIVAIIAMVAFPAYQAQVEKSRRTDGRTALTSLLLAQERYYTVNGAYATNLADTGLSIDSLLTRETTGGVTVINSENGYYQITLDNASASAFDLVATPQDAQTSDDDCTSMTLSHLGVKSGLPATNRCW